MTTQAQVPERIMDSVHSLRHAADILEGAQRCQNHLEAILASWDEESDAERRESVLLALRRLTEATR